MKVKITSEECYNALKDFKVAKTPGTDEFPAEFYRFFWPEINKEMTERLFRKLFILAGFKLLNTHSKIPHLLYKQRRGCTELPELPFATFR